MDAEMDDNLTYYFNNPREINANDLEDARDFRAGGGSMTVYH